MTVMTVRPASSAVGQLLREWRQRRRLSQLDLAIEADISARHLSFVETGRSRPTTAMILRLSEHLEVPLRDRNTLLLAGGYARTSMSWRAVLRSAVSNPSVKRPYTRARSWRA